MHDKILEICKTVISSFAVRHEEKFTNFNFEKFHKNLASFVKEYDTDIRESQRKGEAVSADMVLTYNIFKYALNDIPQRLIYSKPEKEINFFDFFGDALLNATEIIKDEQMRLWFFLVVIYLAFFGMKDKYPKGENAQLLYSNINRYYYIDALAYILWLEDKKITPHAILLKEFNDIPDFKTLFPHLERVNQNLPAFRSIPERVNQNRSAFRCVNQNLPASHSMPKNAPYLLDSFLPKTVTVTVTNVKMFFPNVSNSHPEPHRDEASSITDLAL